jgi:hypothetical protein
MCVCLVVGLGLKISSRSVNSIKSYSTFSQGQTYIQTDACLPIHIQTSKKIKMPFSDNLHCTMLTVVTHFV